MWVKRGNFQDWQRRSTSMFFCFVFFLFPPQRGRSSSVLQVRPAEILILRFPKLEDNVISPDACGTQLYQCRKSRHTCASLRMCVCLINCEMHCCASVGKMCALPFCLTPFYAKEKKSQQKFVHRKSLPFFSFFLSFSPQMHTNSLAGKLWHLGAWGRIRKNFPVLSGGLGHGGD